MRVSKIQTWLISVSFYQCLRSSKSSATFQITSLNHKYFRTHLEDSLSLGRPLLIEDVEEELDPVLDNLLDRNFIKSGSILKVRENNCLQGIRVVH